MSAAPRDSLTYPSKLLIDVTKASRAWWEPIETIPLLEAAKTIFCYAHRVGFALACFGCALLFNRSRELKCPRVGGEGYLKQLNASTKGPGPPRPWDCDFLEISRPFEKPQGHNLATRLARKTIGQKLQMFLKSVSSWKPTQLGYSF